MDQTGTQPVNTADRPGGGTAARPENVYAMSREGKRQALLLLVGVVSIWIFALWSLITILQDGLSGVEFVSALLMLALLVVAPLVGWTLLEEANARIATSEQGIEYRTLGGVNLRYAWGDIAGFKSKEGRGRLARFFLGDEDEETVDNNNKEVLVEAGGPRPGEDDTSNRDGVVETTADAEGGAQSPAVAVEPAEAAGYGYTGEEEDDDEPETLLLKVRNDRTGEIASPVTRFLHRQAHGADLPIYGGLADRGELLGEIRVRVGSSTTAVARNE